MAKLSIEDVREALADPEIVAILRAERNERVEHYFRRQAGIEEGRRSFLRHMIGVVHDDEPTPETEAALERADGNTLRYWTTRIFETGTVAELLAGKPPDYWNGPPRPRARPGSQPWVDVRYERAVGVKLGRTSALLDLMAVRSDGELTQQTVDTVMGNIAWIFEAGMQGPERRASDTAAGPADGGQDEISKRQFEP